MRNNGTMTRGEKSVTLLTKKYFYIYSGLHAELHAISVRNVGGCVSNSIIPICSNTSQIGIWYDNLA